MDCEPQVALRRERSWEVKKAREVLRLPSRLSIEWNYVELHPAYYVTLAGS